ncbi:hypothetical protein HOA55_00325 [archaeon]|jgi:hypothetical protein|nr:hypothetical protein [archaeon]MBT3577855.1 hypothetical protein [archaeon]MBT6819781.1 hypothetical protein [archaeon]MBT6955806.1 hypothetical protein [archaeon]MBT7025563.1 hypothetical protein [archaeon]
MTKHRHGYDPSRPKAEIVTSRLSGSACTAAFLKINREIRKVVDDARKNSPCTHGKMYSPKSKIYHARFN